MVENRPRLCSRRTHVARTPLEVPFDLAPGVFLLVSTGMASVRGSGPSARSWRATYGPPVYGHRSDDLSQTADGSGSRPLRGLLLVILLGVGTHASKQSLGPLEPTLHAAGMGPLGFGALTVVPGIASIVLPTVWDWG